MIREITKAGREGLVLNRCVRCGADAEKTGTNRYDGHDLFKCSSDNCKAEFEETGTGPELLPCCFGEQVEYSVKLDNGELLEFIVLFPEGADPTIRTNKGGANIKIIEDGDSEFFIVPSCLGGQGEKIYPYCTKTQKKDKGGECSVIISDGEVEW